MAKLFGAILVRLSLICYVSTVNQAQAASNGVDVAGGSLITDGPSNPTANCPNDQKGSSGMVTLPLQFYTKNDTCDWVIIVPTGKRVILKFEGFNLPNPCTDNYLAWGEENLNTKRTVLCGGRLPHAQTTSKNAMLLQFRSLNINEQANIKATFIAGNPPKPIEFILVGLVYDDGEPKEWDDDLTNKKSEDWRELQEELCETVSKALAADPQLYQAWNFCVLNSARKVRVRNYPDGEDDDSDDNSNNDHDSDHDKDDSRIGKLTSAKGTQISRPPRGEYMDGIQAVVNLTFDMAVSETGNYSKALIDHLISSKGAQNGTSSFGKNVGKASDSGSVTTECPTDETASSGTVTLPLQSYTANRTCNWKITVPSGKRVILKFDNFSLPNPCTDNYLALGEENLNTKKTVLCGERLPHAQSTSKNIMLLQFRSLNKNAQTNIKATFTAGDPPKPTEVMLVGLVYDDSEPEQWDDDLTNKNSEEWRELQEELCETVSNAVAAEPQIYAAFSSCSLTETRKVKVRNYPDGEDKDDDDKDDNDDSSDNNNGNDHDNSSDKNDNSDNAQNSDEASKIAKYKSAKNNQVPRPPRGDYMNGIEATLRVLFDEAVSQSGNYSMSHIEHLISSKGAQKGVSSFGQNIGKVYPNSATRHGYLCWIVGLLAIASLLN